MAKYAKILDGKVTKIIEATSEYFDTFIDDSPGQWIETFDDASQRGKFAGIGDTYDGTNDRFLPPKTFNSWVFDEDDYKWMPPVDYPTDDNRHKWDEDSQTWTQLDPQ
tara:strand:- start:244 stop:567 length:324 start_codon:yes stop_codon:yes gene_type:complete